MIIGIEGTEALILHLPRLGTESVKPWHSQPLPLAGVGSVTLDKRSIKTITDIHNETNRNDTRRTGGHDTDDGGAELPRQQPSPCN